MDLVRLATNAKLLEGVGENCNNLGHIQQLVYKVYYRTLKTMRTERNKM
jgi:hypothetical protein